VGQASSGTGRQTNIGAAPASVRRVWQTSHIAFGGGRQGAWRSSLRSAPTRSQRLRTKVDLDESQIVAVSEQFHGADHLQPRETVCPGYPPSRLGCDGRYVLVEGVQQAAGVRLQPFIATRARRIHKLVRSIDRLDRGRSAASPEMVSRLDLRRYHTITSTSA
jgi:hypothetical protein